MRPFRENRPWGISFRRILSGNVHGGLCFLQTGWWQFPGRMGKCQTAETNVLDEVAAFHVPFKPNQLSNHRSDDLGSFHVVVGQRPTGQRAGRSIQIPLTRTVETSFDVFNVVTSTGPVEQTRVWSGLAGEGNHWPGVVDPGDRHPCFRPAKQLDDFNISEVWPSRLNLTRSEPKARSIDRGMTIFRIDKPREMMMPLVWISRPARSAVIDKQLPKIPATGLHIRNIGRPQFSSPRLPAGNTSSIAENRFLAKKARLPLHFASATIWKHADMVHTSFIHEIARDASPKPAWDKAYVLIISRIEIRQHTSSQHRPLRGFFVYTPG